MTENIASKFVQSFVQLLTLEIDANLPGYFISTEKVSEWIKKIPQNLPSRIVFYNDPLA